MLPCLQAHAEAVPLRDADIRTHQEDSQASGGASEIPTPGVSAKLSGQRAYLQSLERSSRAWVLSSGKSQAPEDGFGPLEENSSSSNIWYNPIPEEEDGGGPPAEEDVWKRRDEEQEVADLRGHGGSYECPQEGANPSVSHQVHDITEEISGKLLLSTSFCVIAVSLSLIIRPLQTALPQTQAPPV